MKRPYLTVTKVENGWIVTKNDSLFGAAITTPDPEPINVFTNERKLFRYIREQGFIPTKAAKEMIQVVIP